MSSKFKELTISWGEVVVRECRKGIKIRQEYLKR